MTRFFSNKYASLTPYTPGEQPKERKYIKLNTNESPFPPAPGAVAAAAEAAKHVQLYSDPECAVLTKAIAERMNVSPKEVICVNGSDEILNFAFMAFCDDKHPAAFADITYGFYPVFAQLNGVPYDIIPLKDDFSIDPADYIGLNRTIFIANPNAPTGLMLPLSDIERIVASNPDNIVVVDEAYVDFGAESAVSLIHRYDNLLVTQTFSKSRSLAGGRLGFGIACEALIRDLNTVRYSTNPYNVNSMTMAAGVAAMQDDDYMKRNCRIIMENRAYTTEGLKKLGFEVLPSMTNFVFARHPKVSGDTVYSALREKGILVRHFTLERIREFNRITIGTKEQMDALLEALKIITEVQA
ncbi:MAG: histidinol-phosphate transaminase [Clostridia bacterium]|nr:histidinol-phosphate transaminase [Clostridia bacterium]